MRKHYDEVRKILKKYIDEYGYSNIKRDAFDIYREMGDNKKIDNRLAGAVLVTLLSDIVLMLISHREFDAGDTFECIKDCCYINTETIENLAEMYLKLLTPRNIKKWNLMSECKLNDFSSKEWTLSCEDTEYWYSGDGGIECTLKAEATVVVENVITI